MRTIAQRISKIILASFGMVLFFFPLTPIPLAGLDERVTPIETDFTDISNQRKFMDRDREGTRIEEDTEPEYRPIRYFKRFGFSLSKEEETFYEEISARLAQSTNHYKVYYNPDFQITHYEYFNSDGSLELFIRNFYKSHSNTMRLDRTVLFNNFGRPQQVKLYIYNANGSTKQIETYIIEEDAEYAFLDSNAPVRAVGYFTGITQYSYESFGNQNLLVQVETKGIQPTRIEPENEHSSMRFNQGTEGYAEYQQFRSIYERMTEEDPGTLEDLIVRSSTLSIQKYFYNEMKQLVRKELFFHGHLMYYYLYYYVRSALVQKELYSADSGLEQVYNYD